MFILFKLIKDNIIKKKSKSLLIIFTITMCISLFFSSLTISNTLRYLYIEEMRETIGTADLEISASNSSHSPFFTIQDNKIYLDKMDFVVGAVQGKGSIMRQTDTSQINLLGVNIKEFQQMNPIIIYDKLNSDTFENSYVIVSDLIAKKYNLNYGSALTLRIGGVPYTFNVWGIAENTGVFSNDNISPTVILPRYTLSSMLNAGRQVTKLYLKLKYPNEKQSIIASLQMLYPNCSIKEVLWNDEVTSYINKVAISFILVSIIIIILSIFIIYSTFKVIAIEKIDLAGILRSIGATKYKTSLIFFVESLIYGILGGFLGIGTGVGLSSLIIKKLNTPFLNNAPLNVHFRIEYMVYSFLLALVVSLMSSLIPIMQVSSASIRSLVTKQISNEARKNNSFWLIGLFLLTAGILLPELVTNDLYVLIDFICSIFLIIGSIMLIPIIIVLFSKLSKYIYFKIFKNESVLALKNLINNKHLTNNIALLIIGISCTYMINTTGNNIIQSVTNFYTNLNYDIDIHVSSTNSQFQSQLSNFEGVADVMGIQEISNVNVTNHNNYIEMIKGIDTEKISSYATFTNLTTNIKALDNDRNIIITNTLKDAMDVKLGDILTLETVHGSKNYTIIGFFDSIEYYGSMAFISNSNAQLDMDRRYSNSFQIKTFASPETVKKMMLSRYSSLEPQIYTKHEEEFDNIRSNSSKIKVLFYFSIAALVIGSLGIFNNFIINLINRKTVLAIIRSIGMSKIQLIKMLFIESISCGIIGGFMGISIGISLEFITTKILKNMGFIVHPNISLFRILIYILSAVFISCITSVTSIIQTRKMSVIDTLKY